MAAAAVERPGAPPPPQQRYQGVQKDSAGYRLLSAMGWREGEGLGASKQGIKQHIKVKKKFENWGVGAVEAAEHAQNWTNGMLDFHRVLSNLSEVVSEHARRRNTSGGSSSSGDDDEDSDASDGGDASGGRAAGKKRKQPSGSSGSGSSDSGSSSEEEQEEAAAPKRVRTATHIGRFKKREAAKFVKNYSEHDLAAILGADPFAAAAAAVPEVRRGGGRAASSSGYDSDSEPSGDEQAAGAQQQQSKKQAAAGNKASVGGGKAAAAAEAAADADADADTRQQQEEQPAAAPPPMIVVRRPLVGTRPVAPPTPQESRQPGWWQVCFHRAAGPGSVGAAGTAATRVAITVHGFSEEDQTNLYNLAHDKATQGRVGLGRSSMPKKVAGARWEGKKTRIEDSEDDSGEEGGGDGGEGVLEGPQWRRQKGQEGGPAPGGVELEQEEGLVIILPASKRHLLDQLQPQQQQQLQQGGVQPPAAAQAAAPSGSGAGKKANKKARKAAAAAAAAAEATPTPAAAPAAAAQPPAAAAAPSGASLAGIKWKKVVSAALKASAKGKLKLSKLHKAAMKEQGLPKAQRAACLQALTTFLQNSGKFNLRDGVVRAGAA